MYPIHLNGNPVKRHEKPVISPNNTFSMRRVLVVASSFAATGLLLTASCYVGYPSELALTSTIAGLSLASYAIRSVRPTNTVRVNNLKEHASEKSFAQSFHEEVLAYGYDDEILPAPPAALQQPWQENNVNPVDEEPVDNSFMLKTLFHPEDRCIEFDNLENTLFLSPCNGIDKQRWILENQQFKSRGGLCLRSLTPYEMQFDRINGYRCNVTLIACTDPNTHIVYANNSLYSGRFVLIFRDADKVCYFDMKHINTIYQSKEDIKRFSQDSEFKLYNARSPELTYCQHNQHIKIRYPLAISNIYHIELEQQRKHCNEFIDPMIPVNIPNISNIEFPIAVNKDAPRIKRTFLIKQKFTSRNIQFGFNSEPANQKMTGLYTAPGDVITVSVTFRKVGRNCRLGDKDLVLCINFHTDILNTQSPNVVGNQQLKRPPDLAYEKPLRQGISKHRTAYGGSLSLVSFANNQNCALLVTIDGAVNAPYFNIKKHSLSSWEAQQKNPAPWTVLEGRRITTVLPSRQARALENPAPYINLADRMAEECLQLWGFDPLAKATERSVYPGDGNDILVHDAQIVSGIAHVTKDSQYIMINHDHSPTLLMNALAAGLWQQEDLSTRELDTLDTLPHELGHLLHPFRLFDSLGTQPIAAISSEYVLERIFNRSILAENCAYQDAIGRLMDGKRFHDFFGNGDHKNYIAQAIFIRQIIDAFPDRGWEIFKSVASQYRTNSEEQNERLVYSSQQERLDYFFELISNASSHDLFVHFTTWGLPISNHVREKVAHLPLPEVVVSELTGRSDPVKCKTVQPLTSQESDFLERLKPEQIELIMKMLFAVPFVTALIFGYVLYRQKMTTKKQKSLIKIL